MEAPKLIDIWPGKKNGYLVERTYGDTTMEVMVPKAEYEIDEFLSTMDELKSTRADKLRELIEAYGQEKYNAGCDDVHMDNAGEDL